MLLLLWRGVPGTLDQHENKIQDFLSLILLKRMTLQLKHMMVVFEKVHLVCYWIQ